MRALPARPYDTDRTPTGRPTACTTEDIAMRSSFRRSATALAAVVLLSAACGAPETTDAAVDTAPTLALGLRDIATVTLMPIAGGVTITGSLDPAQQVEVKSQIAGQLDSIAVDRGSAVTRGQLLATFDAGPAQAQAASAEAALASAERDLRAADTLYKAGAMSERDFAQATIARDAARAQRAQASENLSRATILAPISGVVSARAVEPGEAVQSGAKLFTIANIDSLELVAGVTPEQAGAVRPGNAVRLTLDAYSGRTVNGRVSRVEPVADPVTRQVSVYVHVQNRDHGLVAGLFASGVIIQRGSAAPVPAIPASAVRTSGTESFVYVIEGAGLARRVVTLGARDDARGMVEVTSGVATGVRVLVNPPDSATAAQARVRLLDDRAATAPATTSTTGGR